ncbi:GAF domain-containing protein [Halorubrum sp. CBA1125]|uniref:hybrid sensor histidine kinase/response regulator n=1 Tax=Halorubrum sp. CBA1125 TaxID=2668072 RepID=UPI0012E81B5C|nr:GAF domain-containing protein [Halorubrum sp. CBA1125]MUW14278.1 GAF domain-containing protein [Halorubrum sp. CBA1125]
MVLGSGAAGDTSAREVARRSDPADEGVRRILFVDGESGVVGRASARVERLVDRAEAITVTDPDDALDAVGEGRVDCVVSGYNLSGVDGVELLAAVREVAPDLPFVLFTDAGSEAVASDAIGAGVTDYVRAEDGHETLAERVRDALARRPTRRPDRFGSPGEGADTSRAAVREFATEVSALFEALPLPIVRAVVADDGAVRLADTNDAFEATFGYAADEHEFPEFLDGIVPDDADGIDLEAVAAGGEAVRTEVRRLTPEGVCDFLLHLIPIDRPDATSVYGVYADIDEQKRVERTLRRLHEATREMFRGSDREEIAEIAARAAIDILEFPSSGVRLYDEEEGALLPTAISEEATEALGERPSLGPGDGRIWEAFDRGEPVRVDDLDSVETAIGYGDHRSLLAVPLGDHGVMPLGSREPGFFDETEVQLARVLAANVTVALDHAERTAQLRERDAALQREIDRLEKFAGLVSHDLRNPLSVAAGRLDLARERVDDESLLADLDRVKDAHDRMMQLIDDLLALARQGQTVDEPERVSLGTAARQAWRTVDTADASLDLADSDAVVRADPERLRTLLENLFTNSVEHGIPNGSDGTSDRDEIGAADGAGAMDEPSETDESSETDEAADGVRTDPSLTVTVGTLADGFYVADDGTGFDIDSDAALEYGTSSVDDGTGFGLAIVREIAAAHGWTLSVEDADGARFEFRVDE